MIGIQENKITKVPLLEAVAQTQAVAAAIASKNFEKAMSYRDSEFKEMLQAFNISSSLAVASHVPDNQKLRIGIIQ
jgi:6-phosphofructokinase 1